jgi:hypothetical protein
MSIDSHLWKNSKPKAQELKASRGVLGDIRPSSLLEYYCKFGKPSFHYAQKGAPGRSDEQVQVIGWQEDLL